MEFLEASAVRHAAAEPPSRTGRGAEHAARRLDSAPSGHLDPQALQTNARTKSLSAWCLRGRLSKSHAMRKTICSPEDQYCFKRLWVGCSTTAHQLTPQSQPEEKTLLLKAQLRRCSDFWMFSGVQNTLFALILCTCAFCSSFQAAKLQIDMLRRAEGRHLP